MAKPKDGIDNPEKSGKHPPFAPGNPGGPGRPKGARNRLGEAFVLALAEDFDKHGVTAIATVRDERPHEYLKVVASLLPKQVEIKEGAFDGIGDEELSALIVAARSALGVAGEGGGRAEAEVQPQSLN
jgi:hypothetical protein